MKKALAFAIAFVLVFAFVACGSGPENESSVPGKQSEPASSATGDTSPGESTPETSVPETPVESSVPEQSTPTPPREYFSFLETAQAVKINGSIAGEDIVIALDNEAVAKSNAKWSINIVLDKVEDGLYEVAYALTGDGNTPTLVLEEDQILMAVHSSSSNMAAIDDYPNVPGKLAAMSLINGDLLAIVGIEEGNIIKLKEYEEGESLEYKLELPPTIETNNFVSFGPSVNIEIRITDNTSIALTKVDAAPAYGDSVLYTYNWGLKLGDHDWENYAVLVCKYDHSVFGYVKDKLYDVDAEEAKKDIEIPEDGFVLAVSKDNEALYAKLSNIKAGDKFFVHGLQTAAIEYSIKEITTAPVIDGAIGLAEWEGYLIDTVDENNKFWDYSQFEVNNYEITAKIYAAYDKDNLYFAVVVDTPDHYCPVTEADLGQMYQYCCLQVNIVDQSPYSDYMAAHYDNIIDGTAVTEGHMRQYGFALTDAGDSVAHVWMAEADKNVFTGDAKIVRDAGAEQTVYEVSVPWDEIGLENVEVGADFGLSISINTTNSTEASANKWKNIKLRDGGGIILRNDWAKIPAVTLD